MSTPILGIMIRPTSITGSLAWTSVGGAIGCDCWTGSVVVVVLGVVVLVVVVVVVVEVVVVDVVDVVVVVELVVVGGSVVVLVVVVGGAVVATVVGAAWAVPSSSVPAHDVINSVTARTEAEAAIWARRAEARRTDVSEEPPFPRANIGTIMSLNHRPSRSIA